MGTDGQYICFLQLQSLQQLSGVNYAITYLEQTMPCLRYGMIKSNYSAQGGGLIMA